MLTSDLKTMFISSVKLIRDYEKVISLLMKHGVDLISLRFDMVLNFLDCIAFTICSDNIEIQISIANDISWWLYDKGEKVKAVYENGKYVEYNVKTIDKLFDFIIKHYNIKTDIINNSIIKKKEKYD